MQTFSIYCWGRRGGASGPILVIIRGVMAWKMRSLALVVVLTAVAAGPASAEKVALGRLEAPPALSIAARSLRLLLDTDGKSGVAATPARLPSDPAAMRAALKRVGVEGEILYHHMYTDPPSSLDSSISAAVDDFVMRCINEDKDKRPATPEEMVRELGELL